MGARRLTLLAQALTFAASCHGPPAPSAEEREDMADAGPAREPSTFAGGGADGSDAVPVNRCPDRPDDPAFVDGSECAGVDAIHVLRSLEYFGIGQAWGDVDGDGWLDLYVTDYDGPNTLYRNLRDGSFEPIWQNLADVESGGAVFVDYDNDGFKDLHVINRGADRLYRNERGAGFADVTERAGLGNPGQGQSSAWADFDGDGWLDVYVVNWFDRRENLDGHGGAEDALYRSNGDGTFEDVTSLLDPMMITGAGFQASWADYDDDGDLDLYVVNDKGYSGPPLIPVINRNVLFRNDGPGCRPEGAPASGFGWCFTEVAESARADARLDSMGLATGDYDNDLDLDFYVTMSPWQSALLQNQGDGTFLNQNYAAGTPGTPLDSRGDWGTVFFDYDHDGWLDLFIARQGNSPLLRNRGDATFEDVTITAGLFFDPRETLGVAAADYDRDGDVDLVVGHRGWGYSIYRNTARAGRHWLSVRLVGGGPVNRDAIGARVTLYTSDGRAMMREVKCGSSLGAGDDPASHFGLGDATPEWLEIRWPDGRVERRDRLPLDAEIVHRYPG